MLKQNIELSAMLRAVPHVGDDGGEEPVARYLHVEMVPIHDSGSLSSSERAREVHAATFKESASPLCARGGMPAQVGDVVLRQERDPRCLACSEDAPAMYPQRG
jgi:hypothetical protein